MKDLTITTQGVKGGNTSTKKVGYVLIELGNESNKITIDNFEGFGDNYKQREFQKIEIIQNGKVLFSGSKYDLFELLSIVGNKVI